MVLPKEFADAGLFLGKVVVPPDEPQGTYSDLSQGHLFVQGLSDDLVELSDFGFDVQYSPPFCGAPALAEFVNFALNFSTSSFFSFLLISFLGLGILSV